jgi:hypothetical protein
MNGPRSAPRAGCFAIRDDDTSFFTRPEELDEVYGAYWGEVPISLAVVPFSVPAHKERSFAPQMDAGVGIPLERNAQLVAYLREKVKAGMVEIMLHGHSHEYRRVGGRWVGEFGWKPQDVLMRETAHGRAYLEDLLDTRVRVFVPPGNTIGAAGIRAVRQAGLGLSGTMGRGGDRPLGPGYLLAYARRWSWRAARGTPYPFTLHYDGHSELCAHALTPRASPARLAAVLDKCIAWKAPFVVASHYWEFKEDPSMASTLAQLVDTARREGMAFAPVSACLTA